MTLVGGQSSGLVDNACYRYDATGDTHFDDSGAPGMTYYVITTIPGWFEGPNTLHFDIVEHNFNSIDVFSDLHVTLKFKASGTVILDTLAHSNEVFYPYTIAAGDYEYKIWPSFLFAAAHDWNLQWRSWKTQSCGGAGGGGGSPPCSPHPMTGNVPNGALWDGSKWTIENTVLPKSEDTPGAMVSDSYQFSTPPAPLTDRYSLWIAQTDNATTTLDRVRLRTLDAPAGTSVALDSYGTAFSYGALSTPSSATTNLGEDVKANVSAADGNETLPATFAYIASGGYVQASYSFAAPGSKIPKLLLNAEVWNDTSVKKSAAVKISSGGQWVDIGTFNMRRAWHRDALDLRSVVSPTATSLTIRIVFQQPVRVDQASYEASAATNLAATYVSLLSARRPIIGNVTSNLTAVDGVTIELKRGEYLVLEFGIPTQQPGTVRWGVLEINGKYVPFYSCP